MEVQAEGYVPWRYPGYNKTTDDALLEQADETRDIQISDSLFVARRSVRKVRERQRPRKL